MSGIGDWEVETGGMLGAGSEQTPVKYPRSEADRYMSNNNKGAASVDNGPGEVNYEVGPYPEVVDDGTEGVDEGDGASR